MSAETRGKLLIVDDEPNIRKTLQMIHRNAGWDTETAESGDAALELLQRESFDVIYLDMSMPGRDGIETLREIRLHKPNQVVVILTGNASIDRAVEATKLGAFDFLEKDCGKDRILLTSRNALDHAALARENRALRQGRRKVEYLGRSDAARHVITEVAKVAPTNARVLILGESGTGKELIAQAIHDRSQRADKSFVKINCAAIPEELIEAELFGTVKGAYTGSVSSREGKFQAADKGTLFLDEIGDMSLKVQTKVLRAIQEGEIERVGSDEIIHVDVRVIAATNKNLAEEVSAGRFREDLYFRLNVVPIATPSLRERPDDIELMVNAFVDEYCAENGLAPKKVEESVMGLLRRYPWPGNVRELRNQVERMVIMSPGRYIRVEDLSAEIRAGIPSVMLNRRDERIEAPVGAGAPADATAASPTQMQPAFDADGKSLSDARRDFERHVIESALEKHHWNVSRAAEALGVERTNLHKKMRQLGIERG